MWPLSLQSELLLLRPWKPADANTLFSLASNPKIGLNAGWKPHQSEEESLCIIENFLINPYDFAICFSSKPEVPIGAISLKTGNNNTCSQSKNEGELGFWIGEEYWGHTYTPKAAAMVIDFAFEVLHFDRIWCSCNTSNKQSARVQEKLGFIYHHTETKITREALQDTVDKRISVLNYTDWQNCNYI